jgi:hypothetical protein
MSTYTHIQRAFASFQLRVSRLYRQRVTEPVQWWLALGRPQQFRPRIPWWQPFVGWYLVLTGGSVPRYPRRRRSR